MTTPITQAELDRWRREVDSINAARSDDLESRLWLEATCNEFQNIARLVDEVERLRAQLRPQPIETAPEFKAVLVQHRDDLYPVTAYKISGEDVWHYEQDGPEDVIEPGDHRHTPLKRPPTFWWPLPDRWEGA